MVIDLLEILDGSMRDLRNLSTDLSHPLLYEIGLKSAIENIGERLAAEHGFSLVVLGEEAMEFPEDVRGTIFQMARELLINVTKHARASTVAVLRSVRLEVVDDGVGLDLATCGEVAQSSRKIRINL